MRLRVWDPGDGHLEEDLDRFFALDQSCFPAGIAYSRDELSAFLAHPSAFSIVLEDQPKAELGHGDLLGFAIARTFRSRGKEVFHIITIDVAPVARRRGAGTMLMDWMAAKARDLRLKTLRLEVAVDNTDALGFYKRLGFTEVGRIECYYLGQTDALVLERELMPARSISNAFRVMLQGSGSS
jgi:ribosomal-protein-alanine N-acetyltransferase